MGWFSGCPVEIVAHRGASLEAPENTLASVNLAWQLGADAVEIDVRLTADEQLVVIHDASLQRTAGLETMVSELAMSRLRKVDVGGWKDEQWRGETLASLTDVLATIPNGRRLFIELKADNDAGSRAKMLAALVECLTEHDGPAESVVLISFCLELLRDAKQSVSSHKVFLVVEQTQNDSRMTSTAWSPGIDEILLSASDAGLDGLDLSNTAAVTSDVVARVASAGLDSCIWTVNSVNDAKRLAAVGVGSLTTDDPRTLIAALSGRSE